jgi:hypothetical protein
MRGVGNTPSSSRPSSDLPSALEFNSAVHPYVVKGVVKQRNKGSRDDNEDPREGPQGGIGQMLVE